MAVRERRSGNWRCFLCLLASAPHASMCNMLAVDGAGSFGCAQEECRWVGLGRLLL